MIPLGPDPFGTTSLAFYAITYGNDNIKRIKRNWFLNTINVLKMHVILFSNSPSLITIYIFAKK